MTCIRCGSDKNIERHHKIMRCLGGSNDDNNLEDRCRPCHKYEHTKRELEASLMYEKSRGQVDRIACYEHRLAVLNKLNTVEIIRERGTYVSYWIDRTTRYLPRRVPTEKELADDKQLNLLLEEAMKELKVNEVRHG